MKPVRDEDPTNDLIRDAAARTERYLSSRAMRAVAPDASAISASAALDHVLPTQPGSGSATIAMLDDIGSPATMLSNGPRYFGFVTGGSHPVATAASILATGWDQNAALPVMSPAVAALDACAARWLIELLGLPAEATANFCGGASEANLIGMITARDAVLADVGWDVGADGLVGAPEVTVIAGAEAHASLTKAVGLAGLGRDRMHLVPTDSQGRLRAEDMPTIAGPTIVALQAGNVNTGHSDPFSEVIASAKNAGAWVHVDGAFGLWAAAAPRRAHLVAGVAGADSWAADNHKWLNVPYDSAFVAVRDGARLARSMRADGAYLGSGNERAPMQLGLQMSQRARAVAVWATIRTLGREGIAALVEQSCALASRMAEGLAAGGATVLCDVVLNQVLVSFTEDGTDRTSAVVSAVQAGGTCWAGDTMWQGRAAMRISVSGWETTEHDVDDSVAAMLTAWREVG